ncbi:TylF/MycF/NovP-related O-methyltransferase [Amycolatopsis sp. 195334CR]|uniref:TylF/MycF/NovP-related O-methyltransferase n=1 Tax=Amycolatopsis sp. 195334CR TaxID=2814588 RepID=UPI001A907EC4|nr:TylF/MycF/NovP-related O-methyltransferase [Amycolatopsis sp. 195334CR]MBN6039537.1 class I SAM-dependent methyltransferase [Amycolatopsis sp. 195334CR]
MTAWYESQRFLRKLRRFSAGASAGAEHAEHLELFRRFSPYSLITEDLFCDNLALVRERLRDLDGAVVECGTWKGGMAAAMMQLGGPGRSYHFYDSFEGGLPQATPTDGEDAMTWQAATDDPLYFDNLRTRAEDFRALVGEAGFPAVHVHEGWFEDTVPRYDGEPIAVLRLDGDWYDSTMVCLDHLYPHVKADGIIILDDYDAWDGCSRAVHDYLSRTKSTARLRRFGDTGITLLHKVDD